MQLSQDSQVSVASGQSNASGGHGSSRKRARPDSIIRDPLHVPTPKLVALHSSSSVGTGTGAGRVGSALSGGSKITGSRPVTTQSRTSSAPASRFRPQ